MIPEAPANQDNGVELPELPEWLKFLRHFELGEGFTFIILLVSSRSLARRCQTDLDLWLQARHQPSLFVLPLKTPEDVSTIPEQLLALAPPHGPIWVDGTGARPAYEQAWNRCAMKLNRARDAIAARFSAPLILVGAPWIREVLQDAAPDFWSVRAFTSEISAPTRVLLPDLATSNESASEFALDPDLALRAIAGIRGKPGRERLLGKLLDRAGRELFLRGRSQEALPLLREAMELNEVAIRLNPARPGDLFNLAVSYGRMGDLQSTLGEGESARSFYEKSLQIFKQLVEQEPGRPDCLRELSAAYSKMGNSQRMLGEGEAARKSYEQSLRIAERLVAQDPRRADYLLDLSVSYDRMGQLHQALGESDAAWRFYEKSLQIRERLVAEEPDRADYLRDLSVSYQRMGYLQTALGEQEAARQFREKSLRIAGRLAAAETSLPA